MRDLSCRLFARKFDPQDTEVFDLLDKIRAGKLPLWRKGVRFDRISIRSTAAARLNASSGAEDGEDDEDEEGPRELCLTLDEPSMTGPKPTGKVVAKMVPCSGGNPRQVFRLGPCSECGLARGCGRAM